MGRPGENAGKYRNPDKVYIFQLLRTPECALRFTPRQLSFITDASSLQWNPSHLSCARVLFASSFPVKFVGEAAAAARLFLAVSLSPAFREAIPRWYWTSGLSGSLAALSFSSASARW